MESQENIKNCKKIQKNYSKLLKITRKCEKL